MKILVTGAGGFIGHHLVKRLKSDGHRVVGCDLKYPEYEPSPADDFVIADLRIKDQVDQIFKDSDRFDEVYHLAADMGGMGFIEANKFVIMRNSGLISINVCEAARAYKAGRLYFSSSACVYNADYQKSPDNPALSEDMAYPAMAEAGYGWEKLYTEMMCEHLTEEFEIETRVARYHNVYGPLGTWRGGREKAPAAMCRKVLEANDGGEMELWGDGEQTRSFMYIDDCLEGTLRIMRSDHREPLNLGSDQLISINDLARMAMSFEDKSVTIRHTPGPLGVRGRNSDNTCITQVLGWAPTITLETGLRKTYSWIKSQMEETGHIANRDVAGTMS